MERQPTTYLGELEEHMSEPKQGIPRALHRILHPTDFTSGSEKAFAHGLKLALAAKGRFYIVHSEDEETLGDVDWAAFPGVRDTLARWGLLEEGVPSAAVAEKLGIRVMKEEVGDRDAVRGVLRFLNRHPCDLMVLATHAREGLPRWLHGSVGEPLSRKARLPALFLPHVSRGFVGTDNGDVLLRSVLIPIDHSPSPSPAVSLAIELAERLEARETVFHLLHIGADGPMMHVDARYEPRLRRLQREGPVVDTIVDAAGELDADLIVMATQGHDGFLDAFRGSTTEQVLRRAGRAVLAVPAA
jgi:nucleotide-binding universal stress UspA family protein